LNIPPGPYQVGHALRDAGVEYNRKQQQFSRKEDLLNPQQSQHRGDFVSIISEDESDNSDADDYSVQDTNVSMSHTAFASSSHRNGDSWASMKIDMEKPFYPRLSFTLIELAMTESADQTLDVSDTPTNQRLFHRDDDANDPFDRAELSEGIDPSFPFSDIFLGFVEDTGDTADVEVANINPRDWLLNS
jgi:hypothetical protein